MSTSPQTLRYVFYGGVEGLYQNKDSVDPDFASPQHGAAAFGYAESQLVTGYLALSGEALAIAQSVPRGTEFSLSPRQSGLDFFFQQPNFGSLGGYTEQDFDFTSTVRMTLGGESSPLEGLRISIGEIPNPLITRSGVTLELFPSGIGARIDGIWLPENVKPLTLSGTSGNDTLRGTAKYNFLSGADGNDNLFLKTGQGWIWGGFGNDSIKGGSKDDYLFGGYGNDKALGRGGNDVIRGGGGHDDLRGEQGADSILGGFGNDSVKGGSGNDDLEGQSGHDKIYGNDGADVLRGGSGNDSIDAGSGNDLIFDGAGDDVLKGGPGADEFSFSSTRAGGRDRVTDFKSGQDTIIIETALYESFEAMIEGGYAVQSGDDVVITYGARDTLTIEDMRLARLRMDDFGFSSPG
ncbi:calcium-binding protein [Microvirga sp. 0TCS3.31]